MKILLIAEHDNQTVKSPTYHAMTAAIQLGTEIDVLVVGTDCKVIASVLQTVDKVTRVLLAENAVYAHQLAENTASLIAELGKQYDYIVAGASTFSKNILPRTAALLNVAMLSDVLQIVTPDTFIRPIYAGNILATVQSTDKIKILTVRTTAFPATLSKATNPAALETVTTNIPNTQTTFVTQTLTKSTRPELTSARVIISGGRGLKSAENFQLLEKIADRLGAAIGASRAAVDAGFAPNDYQVGQTGKVVAPDLYIAVGISGAIQHLAGMKDSKVIVAINNDPDAPIFAIADYGLVGDLFKILPELNAALEKVVSG